MNDTTLIPIMVIAFSGIVVLAIYLERVLDKKKREHFLKMKIDLQLKNNRYSHEEKEGHLKVPHYYDETQNTPKKLAALDEVNL
jgi:hypothetical protein